MPRIRQALGLVELPTPSTFCKAFNRLDIAVWRVMLTLSATLIQQANAAAPVCAATRPL